MLHYTFRYFIHKAFVEQTFMTDLSILFLITMSLRTSFYPFREEPFGLARTSYIITDSGQRPGSQSDLGYVVLSIRDLAQETEYTNDPETLDDIATTVSAMISQRQTVNPHSDKSISLHTYFDGNSFILETEDKNGPWESYWEEMQHAREIIHRMGQNAEHQWRERYATKMIITDNVSAEMWSRLNPNCMNLLLIPDIHYVANNGSIKVSFEFPEQSGPLLQ